MLELDTAGRVGTISEDNCAGNGGEAMRGHLCATQALCTWTNKKAIVDMTVRRARFSLCLCRTSRTNL